MLPKRLYIENFMGHKSSEIDCSSFDSCLIVGLNRQNPSISNGVGKSTIFFAIDYVLYNVYPSKKVVDIIRDGAKKCRVEFEFYVGNKLYKVIRERTKNSAHLFLFENGKDISGKNPSETEEELIKLIKINHKAFKNSILFAQSDLDGIPSASPDKRKDLLKEPLQLSVYNKYYKTAKKKYNEKELEIEKYRTLINSLGEPKQDIKKYSLEIKSIKVEISKLNENRANIQKKLDDKNIELSNLNNMLKGETFNLTKELEDIVNKKNDITKNINDISLNHEKVKNKISNLNNLLSSEQRKLLLANNELSELKKRDLKDVDDIKKEIEKIRERETEGHVLILDLKNKKKLLSSNIPEGTKCDLCFQNISHQHRENYEKYREDELISINEKLIKYEKRLKEYSDSRKLLEKEFNETSIILNKFQTLNNSIKHIESSISTAKTSLEEYSSFESNNDKKLSELQLEFDILINKEQYIKDNIIKSEDNNIKNDIENLKNNIKSIRDSLDGCISLISSKNTMLGVLEEKKSAANENLNKLNLYTKDVGKLQKEISLYEKAIKAFSSHGIPTMIINNILDDLQIIANNILSELRPSLQFQFINGDNDSLDIVFKVYGKDRDYKLLSGGQKLFFALAFKLGLSKVIQSRLGVDIKFLELDEVDQPLDRDGLNAFAEIVKKWSADFKIFVITHNERLRHKFNHFIVVEGDDADGSTAYCTTKWVL